MKRALAATFCASSAAEEFRPTSTIPALFAFHPLASENGNYKRPIRRLPDCEVAQHSGANEENVSECVPTVHPSAESFLIYSASA